MDIERQPFERVYLSAVHNWVSNFHGHNSEQKSFREFRRQISEELLMPVSFDARLLPLIKEYEQGLNDPEKLRLLALLVTHLIQNKFVPKLRGQELLKQLAPLPQKLDNFLEKQHREKWEDLLSEKVEAFCERLLRYGITSRKLSAFWEIVRSCESIGETLSTRMQYHVDKMGVWLSEMLAGIARNNSIDASPRSSQMITEVEYFEELMERFRKDTGVRMKLQLFGSCVNGFGLDSSDLDINLIPEGISLNDDQALFHLFRRVVGYIRAALDGSYELVNQVWKNFRLVELTKTISPNEELDIDLLVGKKYVGFNTKMQLAYSQLDPKIRQMGLLLKLWAKQTGFITKMKMTSYAIIMMLLYYLMRRGIVGQMTVLPERFKVGKLLRKNFSLLNELRGFFNFYRLEGEFFKVDRPRVSLDPNQTWEMTTHNTENMLFQIVDPFEQGKNLCKVLRYDQNQMNSQFSQALRDLTTEDSTIIASMFQPKQKYVQP